MPPRTAAKVAAASEAKAGEWHHYGNTTHGTRYARLDQINASNVGGLKEIWHYRTGRTGQFKATPLQIGELLYFCTAMNVVVALDAETGEKRWEFDPQMKIPPVGFNTTCRGVSYYRAPEGYAAIALRASSWARPTRGCLRSTRSRASAAPTSATTAKSTC